MKRFGIPERWSRKLAVITGVEEHDLGAWFTEEERARIASFKLEKRRKEWAASRIAAKIVAIESGLCSTPLECSVATAFRRPEMRIRGERVETFFSISHSAGAGSFVLDVGPVGIDLQEIRPVNQKVTKFFLNAHELEVMKNARFEEAFFHFWCAKEAAWKVDSHRHEGWYRSIVIEEVSETADGAAFTYRRNESRGRIDSFRVDAHFVCAVATREE